MSLLTCIYLISKILKKRNINCEEKEDKFMKHSRLKL